MYAIVAKDNFYVRTLGYVQTIEEWQAIREKLDACLIGMAAVYVPNETPDTITEDHAQEIEYWAEEVETGLTPDDALQTLLFRGVAP
jgi:hypothetical protein